MTQYSHVCTVKGGVARPKGYHIQNYVYTPKYISNKIQLQNQYLLIIYILILTSPEINKNIEIRKLHSLEFNVKNRER